VILSFLPQGFTLDLQFATNENEGESHFSLAKKMHALVDATHGDERREAPILAFNRIHKEIHHGKRHVLLS